MSRPVLHDDFRDLLQAFLEARVRFVMVGAHALAVHGVPRATGDLDLFVASTSENANRLVQALADFGAPLESHGITAAAFERAEVVYQLGLPPRRIDILTSIDGVEFEDAERTGLVVELDGLKLLVLGRQQLLANKVASGRVKDLADAELLRAQGEDAPGGG
ncbi:MAG: nucleotidyl transferase AbiEii/AbiGii toxin family protein [Acidobacteriota bacterium]